MYEKNVENGEDTAKEPNSHMNKEYKWLLNKDNSSKHVKNEGDSNTEEQAGRLASHQYSSSTKNVISPTKESRSEVS